MILVFCYAILVIITISIILILMIMFSKIELEINKMNISNINKKENNKQLKIKIALKIFNKLTWIKITIDREKLAKLYVKQKINIAKNNIEIKDIEKKLAKEILEDKKIRKSMKNICIDLKKIKLDLKVGTEDYVLTSYIVAIISILISNILPHIIRNKKQINEEKYNYKILPIYSKNNLYKIELDCIINAKMGNIIYVIYLIKRRGDKNERTSNRKSYEYSYE